MKRFRFLLFMLSIIAVILSGCSMAKDNNAEDLQRLSRIDIYSQNGDLVKSITDEASLRQLSDIIGRYAPQDAESLYADFEKDAKTLPVLYEMIFYKIPASRLNDGELEEELCITIYENSNTVKETISPGNIKSIYVPKEYLTFYFNISDEDRALFISSAEK